MLMGNYSIGSKILIKIAWLSEAVEATIIDEKEGLLTISLNDKSTATVSEKYIEYITNKE